MAGTDPSFNADEVAGGFLFAQRMGLPVAEADQPRFFNADEADIDPADTTSGGDLWDPWADVDVAPNTGTLAVCGVKVLSTSPDETAAGGQRPAALELTFTPAEWAKVSTFTRMTYYGLDYTRHKMLAKRGALFELQMQRVEVRAFDRAGSTS